MLLSPTRICVMITALKGCEQPLSSIRREVGFVPQDDVMHSNLKVQNATYTEIATAY